MEKVNASNYYGYNRYLKTFARALRRKGTKAEACLWKYVLRAKQMKGYSFRRQRPVLNYIADFMCKELLLIIEVDGITHELPDVAAKDRIRQKELENVGFALIRFTDDDVLTNISGVYDEISQWIEKYKS